MSRYTFSHRNGAAQKLEYVTYMGRRLDCFVDKFDMGFDDIGISQLDISSGAVLERRRGSRRASSAGVVGSKVGKIR